MKLISNLFLYIMAFTSEIHLNNFNIAISNYIFIKLETKTLI